MKCLCCNNETSNPKFCNSSCAASYNNTTSPKRKLTNTCKTCSELIPSKDTYCSPCWKKHNFSGRDWSQVTKGDMINTIRYFIRRLPFLCSSFWLSFRVYTLFFWVALVLLDYESKSYVVLVLIVFASVPLFILSFCFRCFILYLVCGISFIFVSGNPL